jgi:uncharacterized protein
MVYSALLAALVSGSALHGAMLMAAFGAGTLPLLLAAGVAGSRLRAQLRHPRVRRACGLLVMTFGALMLARATGGAMPAWLATLCSAPMP